MAYVDKKVDGNDVKNKERNETSFVFCLLFAFVELFAIRKKKLKEEIACEVAIF